MRKIGVLLLAIAVSASGFVVYSNRQAASLLGELNLQVSAIEEAYGSIVEDRLQPLARVLRQSGTEPEESGAEGEEGAAAARVSGITPEQRELLQQVGALQNRLGRPEDAVPQRLNTVNRLQIALHRFSKTFAGRHPLAGSAELAAFDRAIGERGEVRKLLSVYNDTAKQWNNLVQGQLGSLSASVSGDSTELYPYLRFNGQAGGRQQIQL